MGTELIFDFFLLFGMADFKQCRIRYYYQTWEDMFDNRRITISNASDVSKKVGKLKISIKNAISSKFFVQFRKLFLII